MRDYSQTPTVLRCSQGFIVVIPLIVPAKEARWRTFRRKRTTVSGNDFIRQSRTIPEGSGAIVSRLFPLPGFRNFDPFVLMDHFTLRMAADLSMWWKETCPWKTPGWPQAARDLRKTSAGLRSRRSRTAGLSSAQVCHMGSRSIRTDRMSTSPRNPGLARLNCLKLPE